MAITTRGHQQARLPAGFQTRFSATDIETPARADPAREAWHRGILLADDIRLDELVKELGHYQHGFINVAPEVAGLQVFGGYPLAQPERALTMLEAALPIRIQRPLPWWTEIGPGPGFRAEEK